VWVDQRAKSAGISDGATAGRWPGWQNDEPAICRVRARRRDVHRGLLEDDAAVTEHEAEQQQADA
jgi:hypothetical protein